MAEALPGYEASIWLGLMAPAATPLPIRERLHAEVNRIMALPATREAQARAGAQPMPMTRRANSTPSCARTSRARRNGIRMAGITAN